MFLKQLIIDNDGTVIRQILFHKGINLIVDETSAIDRTKSGNNVGKTTVLRLIDYCLGSSGENIYRDTEFKEKSNTEIEHFLKNENICITLTLKEDLEVPESREIVIRRNFLSRRDKILEINGEKETIKSFPSKLKQVLFGSTKEKPTARQILSKNIRDEKNRLTNTIKVLHHYTKKEEYESLYLFWLGLEQDTDSRKQALLRDQKIETMLLRRLKRETSLSQIEQSLLVVNRTVEELSTRKNNFNLNENYEEELNQLNQVKLQTNQLATKIGRLELRRDLIIESKKDLESEKSDIDTDQVKRLYNEAKSLIPDLQKSFAETLEFHNQMVSKRAEYISKELPQLEQTLVEAKREVSRLLHKESDISKSLTKAGAIEELQEIILELNRAFETKGGLEEKKKLWMDSLSKLEQIDSELQAINAGIDSKDNLIQQRVSEFNKFFSDISYRLYGERFVLSADQEDKGYELNIGSISGNLGTGKKKGQIAAFDLAYIQFADSLGIECVHFILHDQIENVHDNQISSLVTEIVADMNCQYVLPVLRDKLPSDINIDQFEILSLSQTDKLFKV